MQQIFKNIFPELPGYSRIWIYSSDREFTGTERIYVKEKLQEFVDGWAAHGKGLLAAADVLFDRFIVLAVDEQKVRASGCSIDSSVRFIKELGGELNVDFFNRLKLYVVKDEEIKRIHIVDLKLHENDLLFDPMIADLNDFRNNWLIPVKESLLFKQMN
jgi:hypothetical protein